MKLKRRWIVMVVAIGLAGYIANEIWHFSLETKVLIAGLYLFFASTWYADLAVQSLRDELQQTKTDRHTHS